MTKPFSRMCFGLAQLRVLSLATLSCALPIGCGGESSMTDPSVVVPVDAGPAPEPDAGPGVTQDAAPDRSSPDGGAAPDEALVVTTAQGTVRGAQAHGALSFLGIPYAAPPVGALRWQPPEPPSPWEDVRDASSFAPPCPQLSDGTAVGDEDCLYLNVWTPDPRPEEGPLPVMVFIHGGGNTQGSPSHVIGGIHIYDGSRLASRARAVVVTMSYRLGALGFLAHPALSAESPEGVSGNYGLRDQIAALEWVQREIPAFGGDPERVLLFGESAGGRNVCSLVASPLAEGLLSRALIQSGSCRVPPLEDRLDEGATLAEGLDCDGEGDEAACLRSLDARALISETSDAPVSGGLVITQFGAAVDGVVLPVEPIEALRQGTHNHVPLIVGANEHETSVMGVPARMTEAEYRAAVVRQLGQELGNEALSHYPVDEYDSPRAAYVALTSDVQFICPARGIARAAAASQAEPVYRYHYTHVYDSPQLTRHGASHGFELFLVFQQLEALEGYAATNADRALEEAVRGYWSRFAATGTPNGAGDVEWPMHDPATDPYLELGNPVGAGEDLHGDDCDFWDDLSSRR